MKGVVIALVVVAMVQFMVKPGEAVDCEQVDSSLAGCVPFLTGGGSPSPTCCNGVKSLQSIATTIADKQAACECVKAAAARYPNINADAASSLPAKCGITFDIPISKNTNCKNII